MDIFLKMNVQRSNNSHFNIEYRISDHDCQCSEYTFFSGLSVQAHISNSNVFILAKSSTHEHSCKFCYFESICPFEHGCSKPDRLTTGIVLMRKINVIMDGTHNIEMGWSKKISSGMFTSVTYRK